MMESCNNLEELNISNWSALTHFADDGLPTRLRALEIVCCNNLEFMPEETFHNYKYLERLYLLCGSCDSMTSFPLGLFPSLKDLEIGDNTNLELFSIADDHHENLKSLQTVHIYGCEKLIDFPRGGLPASNLKSLWIGDCKNLKSLPEGMRTQLTSLETLSIVHCEQVESFPAGGLPSNLRILGIWKCKKVMAKRREWGLQNLLFLTSLIIGICQEIESFPEADCQLPISLTMLELWSLPNLERIEASRLLNLSALRTFKIDNCPKVKFDPIPRNTQHLPTSFHTLSIYRCPLLAKRVRTMKRDLIPDLQIDGKPVL